LTSPPLDARSSLGYFLANLGGDGTGLLLGGLNNLGGLLHLGTQRSQDHLLLGGSVRDPSGGGNSASLSGDAVQACFAGVVDRAAAVTKSWSGPRRCRKLCQRRDGTVDRVAVGGYA
jgi:hypothetical protein